jgi:hypothetical protein
MKAKGPLQALSITQTSEIIAWKINPKSPPLPTVGEEKGEGDKARKFTPTLPSPIKGEGFCR